MKNVNANYSQYRRKCSTERPPKQMEMPLNP
ncbi:hypothetical protein DP49_4466 [Burkholderia pseudomallei]|nr:hypothetical protein DP49_4466 [Burkholderia pseudomallei]KGW25576.1 hypothetical protein Y602_6183 [Burkholderia pseudomallei MSHR733]